MILIHIWTDSSLTYFHFRSTVCELGANNEQIWLPRFITKTLFKIINTTKSGFQIVKSATILKNNSKNVIYWRKIHLVDIQGESLLVNLTMACWTDIHTMYAHDEQSEISGFLKKSHQYFSVWRNHTNIQVFDTNISVVGKSVLKLMNYVFYLILKSPSSYYDNPERYIMMQPTHIICTVPGDKMRSKLLIKWYVEITHYLIIINKTILYGKHKLFQQK